MLVSYAFGLNQSLAELIRSGDVGKAGAPANLPDSAAGRHQRSLANGLFNRTPLAAKCAVLRDTTVKS